MTGYLRPLCEHVSLLRMGPMATAPGDPYVWRVLVEHRGDHVLLIGMTGEKFETEEWESIARVLFDAGVRIVGFDRWKRGHATRHWFRLVDGNALRLSAAQYAAEPQEHRHMKVKITFEATDDDGTPFARHETEQTGLDKTGVHLMEKALVTSLVGLGDAAEQMRQTASADSQ